MNGNVRLGHTFKHSRPGADITSRIDVGIDTVNQQFFFNTNQFECGKADGRRGILADPTLFVAMTIIVEILRSFSNNYINS